MSGSYGHPFERVYTDDEGSYMELRLCEECGAIVGDMTIHDEWHEGDAQ